MKWFGATFFAFTVLSFGSLWYLGYLAFGQAKCTGINPFATTTLGILLVLMIFLIFNSLDWLNDFLASRAVTKAQIQTNKNLTEQARTIGAQLLAQRRLAPPPEPEPGGLDFGDGVFEEYTG